MWADVIGERFMETPKERGQIKLETYEKTRFYAKVASLDTSAH